MVGVGGRIAALAPAMFLSAVVFGVLPTVPSWLFMLSVVLNLAIIAFAAFHLGPQLDATRRRLRDWQRFGRELSAKDKVLTDKAQAIGLQQADLRRQADQLQLRETNLKKDAQANQGCRGKLNLERDALNAARAQIDEARQELEARQGQVTRREDGLQAIAIERQLLPLHGSFFETPREAMAARVYAELGVAASVRPLLATHEGAMQGVLRFMPLLGVPAWGAMHVHLTGPPSFRTAYREQAEAFAQSAELLLIVTDEDTENMQATIQAQAESKARNSDSPKRYEHALHLGRVQSHPSNKSLKPNPPLRAGAA